MASLSGYERPIHKWLFLTQDRITSMIKEDKGVSGAKRQYVYNMKAAIDKWKRRDKEIDDMKKYKAEKYRQEYEMKMHELEASMLEKHLKNDESLVAKSSNMSI